MGEGGNGQRNAPRVLCRLAPQVERHVPEVGLRQVRKLRFFEVMENFLCFFGFAKRHGLAECTARAALVCGVEVARQAETVERAVEPREQVGRDYNIRFRFSPLPVGRDERNEARN